MPHHQPYSTVHGDIWALGCILAEMIANGRPWWMATPEDKDYSDYLMDRAVLFDVLPVSNAAWLLLLKIFSPKPERRPSLATIREEVLAMDTFFLTDVEAGKYGWVDRLEKQMLRKMRACRAGAVASRSSESSSSSGSFETCTLEESSASRNSYGSSTSAFDPSSAESSELPVTPPSPGAAVHTVEKTSRVMMVPRVAVAQAI